MSQMIWSLILNAMILATITLVSIFVPNGLWSMLLAFTLQNPFKGATHD